MIGADRLAQTLADLWERTRRTGETYAVHNGRYVLEVRCAHGTDYHCTLTTTAATRCAAHIAELLAAAGVPMRARRVSQDDWTMVRLADGRVVYQVSLYWQRCL